MTNEGFQVPLRRLANGTYVIRRFFSDEKCMQDLASANVYEDDIWIVTYPKSGTTWTQALVSLVCTNPADLLNHSQSLINNTKPIENIDLFPTVQNAPRPRQIKSHLPYDLLPQRARGSHPPKIIYVARNGKDVCVSAYHYMRDVQMADYSYRGSFETFCDLYSKGEVPYGSWLKHVEAYWNERHRENILFVTYEDMKQDLPTILDRIVSFLGKPPLNNEHKSLIIDKLHFDNMKKDTVFNPHISERAWKMGNGKFMRKGIVGDWRNFMTPEMSEEFDDKFLNPMKELGLVFEK